jgi:hypothetical protein
VIISWAQIDLLAATPSPPSLTCLVDEVASDPRVSLGRNAV